MGFWIVVVDDEPLSLTNAKAMLNRHDMRVSCLRSGQDLLRFMEKNSPDLILLDILMPGMDGFDTYRALRQFEEGAGRAQIPVIFLTGEDNHETERRGLKAGASDFIHKPFDEDILLKRIHNSIVNSKTIESLTEEATLDRLTGFLNKASGTEKVSGLCRETTGALMILDLDNFKLVNDLYGHDMGDRVLVEFASIFRYNVRKEDVISRIGGDEFLAFFPQMTHREEVAAFT
ncbi:MAG: response regulator, partial [Lachnospiraceae bacterium]|nr:response regulator [Lachnospiraceae bacterium]